MGGVRAAGLRCIWQFSRGFWPARRRAPLWATMSVANMDTPHKALAEAVRNTKLSPPQAVRGMQVHILSSRADLSIVDVKLLYFSRPPTHPLAKKTCLYTRSQTRTYTHTHTHTRIRNS